MTGSSSPATGTLMQPTRRENPGARHGTRTLLAPHREAHDPEPPRGPVVLHVVEAFGGGVAAAVRDYARATPECDHHLLCHLRPEAVNLEDEWDTDFASVRFLPGGHLANLKATRWAISEIHPDVIHSHSSYAGVYARLAVGHLPRKPVDTLSPLRTPGPPPPAPSDTVTCCAKASGGVVSVPRNWPSAAHCGARYRSTSTPHWPTSSRCTRRTRGRSLAWTIPD